MWSPTHIQITVGRAKNLKAKGKNGTNDVYVKIKLGTERFQTSVCERTKEPEWWEQCDFPLVDGKSMVKLKVFHRNLVGRDDFLGQIELSPDQFKVHERPKAKWYPLMNKPGSKATEQYRGEIEVVVSFNVKSLASSQLTLNRTSSSAMSSGVATGLRALSNARSIGDKLSLRMSKVDSKHAGSTGSSNNSPSSKTRTSVILPMSYNKSPPDDAAQDVVHKVPTADSQSDTSDDDSKTSKELEASKLAGRPHQLRSAKYLSQSTFDISSSSSSSSTFSSLLSRSSFGRRNIRKPSITAVKEETDGPTSANAVQSSSNGTKQSVEFGQAFSPILEDTFRDGTSQAVQSVDEQPSLSSVTRDFNRNESVVETVAAVASVDDCVGLETSRIDDVDGKRRSQPLETTSNDDELANVNTTSTTTTVNRASVNGGDVCREEDDTDQNDLDRIENNDSEDSGDADLSHTVSHLDVTQLSLQPLSVDDHGETCRGDVEDGTVHSVLQMSHADSGSSLEVSVIMTAAAAATTTSDVIRVADESPQRRRRITAHSPSPTTSLSSQDLSDEHDQAARRRSEVGSARTQKRHSDVQLSFVENPIVSETDADIVPLANDQQLPAAAILPSASTNIHSNLRHTRPVFRLESVDEVKPPDNDHNTASIPSWNALAPPSLGTRPTSMPLTTSTNAVPAYQHPLAANYAREYANCSRDELLQLVVKQRIQLREREAQVADMERYIDNLLAKVLDQQPLLLCSPCDTGSPATSAVTPTTAAASRPRTPVGAPFAKLKLQSTAGPSPAATNRNISPFLHRSTPNRKNYPPTTSTTASSLSTSTGGTAKRFISNPFSSLQTLLK